MKTLGPDFPTAMALRQEIHKHQQLWLRWQQLTVKCLFSSSDEILQALFSLNMFQNIVSLLMTASLQRGLSHERLFWQWIITADPFSNYSMCFTFKSSESIFHRTSIIVHKHS